MPPISEQPYPADFLAARRRDLQRARSWLVSDLRALGAGQADAERASTERLGGAYSLSTIELSVSPHASARALLHEVDDALARLEAGLYGWDPASGSWIRPARLAAAPTARHEIEGLIRLGRPVAQA